MINFAIVSGPDGNVQNEYRYFQNQIYLGRTTGDLWISDPDLLPSHLMLEVIGKELLIHPQKNVEYYLLNGKRATVIRKLKVKDEVTFGKTTLRILSYEETQKETKKEILNRKLHQLMEENSPKLSIIESLTTKMKT